MDPAGSPCLCDTVAMVDCPAHGEHSAVGRGIDFSAYFSGRRRRAADRRLRRLIRRWTGR